MKTSGLASSLAMDKVSFLGLAQGEDEDTHVPDLRGLAIGYARSGNYPRSVSAWVQHLVKSPLDASGWEMLAQVQLQLDLPMDAIRSSALSLVASFANGDKPCIRHALLTLARAHLEMGELLLAIHLFSMLVPKSRTYKSEYADADTQSEAEEDLHRA